MLHTAEAALVRDQIRAICPDELEVVSEYQTLLKHDMHILYVCCKVEANYSNSLSFVQLCSENMAAPN